MNQESFRPLSEFRELQQYQASLLNLLVVPANHHETQRTHSRTL